MDHTLKEIINKIRLNNKLSNKQVKINLKIQKKTKIF